MARQDKLSPAMINSLRMLIACPRVVNKNTAKALKKRGLAVYSNMVKHNGKHREAYAITDTGRKVVEGIDHDEAKRKNNPYKSSTADTGNTPEVIDPDRFTPDKLHKYVPTRKGPNGTWCVPYSVAVLTGRDYKDVWDQACRIAGRKVKGMSPIEIARLLFWAGLPTAFDWSHMVPGAGKSSPPLSRALAQLDREGVFLVFVTGHVITVAGSKVIDNVSNGWIDRGAFPGQKRKVRAVLRIDQQQ